MAVAPDDDVVAELVVNGDNELGHEGLQVVTELFGVLLCPLFDGDGEPL